MSMRAPPLLPKKARQSWGRRIERIGVVRMLACCAMLFAAGLIARTSWSLPLTRDWERSLYNWRVYVTAPRVDQDKRIVEVAYTDDTLAALGKRSPLDRTMLAKALRNLDTLGAKGIAIDILIDQPQDDDAVLVDAFRRMQTPTWLAYTSAAENPDQVLGWQQDFMDSFAKRIATAKVHRASIRVETDRDNVVRSWPDQPKGFPWLIANALTGIDQIAAGYTGGLRFRVPVSPDRPEFEALPIDLFAQPEAAAAMRGEVAGRYVLIGGTISDTDKYDTPITRTAGPQVFGLDVHAVMLAQLLDGAQPKVPPPWTLTLAAVVLIVTAAATSIVELRTWQNSLLILFELAVIAVLPNLLQHWGVDTLTVPAAGWAIGWAMAFAATGTAVRAFGSDQRRFAQSALGRYLPRDVALEIMRDPEQLSLSGEKREIVALFTDLEGFTKLSHAISPEMVAYLLNRYLDMMCAIVLAHGGTIDKFVGDAVVAFWGAPIARADDDQRALAAAIAMYEAGERFRTEAPEGVPPIGRTRVGLHRGEAVVGNFGGEGRIQYTALGDAMNTASRLESANKHLRTAVLVSGTVARLVDATTLRAMGRIVVSGRSTPIAVYEAGHAMPDADRRALAALYTRYDRGDPTAIEDFARFEALHPTDVALALFIERLKIAGPGGSYALDSK